MSKMLDVLNQASRKKYDYIQEQLAEIYISPTKKKKIDTTTEVKPVRTLNMGWITLVVLLVAISSVSLWFLVSKNRLNINITVIEEERIERLVSRAEDRETEMQKESLQINLSTLPSNIATFNGSAVMESRMSNRYLYLVNSRGPGWANVKIKFDEPINVADSILSFAARGEKGGEALSIVLKDSSNNAYQSINIAPEGLSKDWGNISLNLNEVRRWVDLTRINQMCLEFGSSTANNPIDAVIYVKDIHLIKQRD